MDENYMLELLRSDHSSLAKRVWGLEKRNEELESTLFYARMAANHIIDNQRLLISDLLEQREDYLSAKQEN